MPQAHPLHGVRVAILVASRLRRHQCNHFAGAAGGSRLDAKPTEFDALLLPGGVRGADTLRADNKAVLFVHAMQIARKPIAAIRHGAQRHFECRWRLGEFGGRRGRVARDHPKAGPPVQRGDDRAVFAGKKCSGGVLATVA